MVTTKEAFDPSKLEQQNTRRKQNKEAKIRKQALTRGIYSLPSSKKTA